MRFLIYTDGNFRCEFNGTQSEAVRFAIAMLDECDRVRVMGLVDGKLSEILSESAE